MKLAVGILLANGFPVPADFVVGWSLLQQALLTPASNALMDEDNQIEQVRVIFGHDFPIDHARNRLVRIFLDESNSDALLFLDSDMKHPPDLAHRLVHHRVDVVTARYTMRRPPFFSVAMRKTGDGPTDYQAVEKLVPLDELTGLVPVDGGGAGALLVSRTCYQAIRERIGDDWYRYQDGPDGKRSRSEDMWFYEQAIAAGFQPYLDADTHCGHVAQFLVDHTYHKPYAEQYQKAMAEKQEVSA